MISDERPGRLYSMPEAMEMLLAAYRDLGLDAREEVENIDNLTTDELLDEVQYVADYQG